MSINYRNFMIKQHPGRILFPRGSTSWNSSSSISNCNSYSNSCSRSESDSGSGMTHVWSKCGPMSDWSCSGTENKFGYRSDECSSSSSAKG
jgi:hypothetical protein